MSPRRYLGIYFTFTFIHVFWFSDVTVVETYNLLRGGCVVQHKCVYSPIWLLVDMNSLGINCSGAKVHKCQLFCDSVHRPSAPVSKQLRRHNGATTESSPFVHTSAYARSYWLCSVYRRAPKRGWYSLECFLPS